MSLGDVRSLCSSFWVVADHSSLSALPGYINKLFGLSISAERLAEVRNERRPGSRYAALENCRYEVNEAEALMRRRGIPWLSSTNKSIEEIATTILQEIKLETPGF